MSALMERMEYRYEKICDSFDIRPGQRHFPRRLFSQVQNVGVNSLSL